MNAVFRVDYSGLIGIGHLFRCLTLANALRQKGLSCVFLSRSEDARQQIENAGHELVFLTAVGKENIDPEVKHASWLSIDWQADAEESLRLTISYQPFLLVVDHYALDYKWERIVKNGCKAIVVIDDLADRKHACDMLIDSNYARAANAYGSLLDDETEVLTGADFALLKPDFPALRERAIERRKNTRVIRHVLVFMGGGDPGNVTAVVLSAMSKIKWPEKPVVHVVLSSLSKHVNQIRKQLSEIPFETRLTIDTPHMEKFMLEADLAVGASGSSTWERCCLGLPSVNVLIADNQQYAHQKLARAGVIEAVNSEGPLEEAIVNSVQTLVSDMKRWQSMSGKCFSLIDGLGTDRVVSRVLSYS